MTCSHYCMHELGIRLCCLCVTKSLKMISLESARMWMQDQIDRGADMVMSPMCCLVGNLPRTKHGHHSCSLMSCNIRLGHMGG